MLGEGVRRPFRVDAGYQELLILAANPKANGCERI